MIIAFTVNNRPHYLKETLASWEAVRGIGDAHLVFRCEPHCPEAVSLCQEVTFADRIVTVNRERSGVLANPWHALEQGSALGEFVILAEEDLIVSPDVLE